MELDDFIVKRWKGSEKMRVFMIGGTGLLGSEAARELIKRGHEVSSIALPPLPEGGVLPPEMKIEYKNYLEMSDDEIHACMKDCEGFVFAAGIDERVEGKAPIYDLYAKYNILPLHRLLKIAKEEGVKHVVILGSYFSHFAKKWLHLELTTHHPYIRSRIDQENVALKYADENFDVAILELPYIFGTQPGRKPVWTFLIEMIQGMKKSTYYPKGGTTMVTVEQVATAIAGALEKNRGGNCYPIGYYNMEWTEFLGIVHKHMGYQDRKVVSIPKWLFRMAGRKIAKRQKDEGVDPGLNMVKFADMQCANLFIDKNEGAEFLGVTGDDIDAAIGDSVKLSLDVINHKIDAVEMKGE